MTPIHSRDAVLSAFDCFREDLDDHNDRRERLIKVCPTLPSPSPLARAHPLAFDLLQASRDVTNLSKKVIFLLHRTMTEDMAEHDDRVLGRRAAARAKGKLREIRSLFAAMRPELAGERFARYQRNVSPGLQEYIEALSFAHYLEHRTLISFDAVRGSLCDDEGCPVSLIASPSSSGHGSLTSRQYFPLPLEDYLLGLSDLTGELMRFAIATIPRRGGRQKATDVCTFVRSCRAGKPTDVFNTPFALTPRVRRF